MLRAVQANALASDLAAVTGARPVLAPAPALVSSPALRRALVRDPAIGYVMKSWQELDLALVGIGSVEPSPLLQQSGNALSQDEQEQLRGAGAVGDDRRVVRIRVTGADGRASPWRAPVAVEVGLLSAAGLDRADDHSRGGPPGARRRSHRRSHAVSSSFGW